MVGLDRVELSTSPLSGARSSQLSYRPFWPTRAWRCRHYSRDPGTGFNFNYTIRILSKNQPVKDRSSQNRIVVRAEVILIVQPSEAAGRSRQIDLRMVVPANGSNSIR